MGWLRDCSRSANNLNRRHLILYVVALSATLFLAQMLLGGGGSNKNPDATSSKTLPALKIGATDNIVEHEIERLKRHLSLDDISKIQEKLAVHVLQSRQAQEAEQLRNKHNLRALEAARTERAQNHPHKQAAQLPPQHHPFKRARDQVPVNNAQADAILQGKKESQDKIDLLVTRINAELDDHVRINAERYTKDLPNVHEPARYVLGKTLYEKLAANKTSCKKDEAANKICWDDPRIKRVDTHVYPLWICRMPNFVSDEHRRLVLSFQQVKYYRDTHDPLTCPEEICHGLMFPPDKYLTFWSQPFHTGDIITVENGIYTGYPTSSFAKQGECEWDANYKWLVNGALDEDNTPNRFKKLTILLGPQGDSFQHFFDRLMPDVAQAWDYMLEPGNAEEMQLFAQVRSVANVEAMWRVMAKYFEDARTAKGLPLQSEPRADADALSAAETKVRESSKGHVFHHGGEGAWDRDVLVNYNSHVLTADEMTLACRVPRFHPWLWQKMQRILHVETDPKQIQLAKPENKRNIIVYLGRTNRRIAVNQEEVKEAIAKRVNEENARLREADESWQWEFHDYKASNFTYENNLKFFNERVRAIIAPHGGAMYNMMYCAQPTLIIEFFPYLLEHGPAGQQLAGSAWPEGFWWQAEMLGFDYWMLPYFSLPRAPDYVVEISDVYYALEHGLFKSKQAW